MQLFIGLLALASLTSASPSPSSKRQSTNGGITVPLFKHTHDRPVVPGILSAKQLAKITSERITDVDALQAARDALIDKYVEGSEAKRRIQQKRAERDFEEHKRAAIARGATLEKRVVQDVAMTNHNFDTVYSANIQLGTPPKEFKVLLDTGSSDTWVTASNCSCLTAGCNSCAAGASWDPSSSSTYSQRGKVLSISYGSGTVTGITGKDVASLGGFTIPDQVVGIVNSAARVLPGDVEGLMGLAFGLIARGGGTPWWLRVLVGEAGQTFDSPMISFWLSRYVDAGGAAGTNHPGGQFVIGGTNSSLYQGDISYFDVIQPAKWWLINLGSVGRVDGNSVDIESTAQQSIIDTGTTLIGGEDVVIDSILGNIEGSVKGEQIANKMRGFYALPCDSNATITFTFSGQTYTMSPRDLLYMRIDDLRPNYCLCSLFTYSSADRHSIDYRDPNSPYWLIGAAFLKNVYSVFTLGDSAGDGTPAGVQGMGNTGGTAKVGFAALSGQNGEVGMAVGAAVSGGGESSSGAGASASGSATATRQAETGVPVGLIPDVMTTVVVVTATEDAAPSSSTSGGRRGALVGFGAGLGLVLALVGAMVL